MNSARVSKSIAEILLR